MKKTSRKRALVSSIAMLLVSAVAVGSATYAWFAANPNATASGLSMKTTASTGLVISTDTDTSWSHSATLAKDLGTLNFTPASQVQSDRSFVTIDAVKSSAKDAGPDEESPYAENRKFSSVTAGHESANKVYSENVYFRLSDGTASSESKTVVLNGIKLKATTYDTDYTDMAGAIRVAIYNGTDLNTYALSSAMDDKTIPADSANKTFTEVKDSLVDFASLDKTLTSDSTKAVNVTAAEGVTVNSGTTKSITVYVYLDGQDGACYSDAVGTVNAQEIINNLELSFTLAD